MMKAKHDTIIMELRLTCRYIIQHPWVVTAVSGFLSAYFMEQPDFRVQRHGDELDSGMHVWVCEFPASMKMDRLLKRLQADIPAFHATLVSSPPAMRPHYLIDCPESSPI